jgi:hypothetical protein
LDFVSGVIMPSIDSLPVSYLKFEVEDMDFDFYTMIWEPAIGYEKIYSLYANRNALPFILELLKNAGYVAAENGGKIVIFAERKQKPTVEESEMLSSTCPHCGLSMEEHNDPDFCPPGTEAFGGRR